jgi:hypothetical protein
MNGTCVRTGQAGQPCVGANSACARGNACNGSGICAPIRHAALGASCKPVGDESVDCPDGYCANSCPPNSCACAEAQSVDWTCRPYPAASESCNFRQCGQVYDCAARLSCIKGVCAAITVPPVPAGCGP